MRRATMVLLAALPACTVGPDHEMPKTELAADWRATPDARMSSAPADLAHWWEGFADPVLHTLVEEATQRSPNLELAASRVREARFRRAVATGDFGPTIDADAGYTLSSNSKNEIFNFISGAKSLWSAGFDASWELDVFGGVRREREAADAEVSSAVEDYRDALVSLIAEVVRNWVELTSLRERLAVARGNERVQQDTLDLVQSRFQAGVVSALDVALARGNLATTRARIPTIQAQIEAADGRLAVLLGLEPGTLVQVVPGVEQATALPRLPEAVAVGVPADLMRRRPDIRRAERQVAAAGARIGVAEADYYPHFTLNGSVGMRSRKAENLFDADSFRWSWGPGFSWNLFATGRVRNNVRAVEEVHEQTLTTYQQTVLQALDETRNAITAFAKEQERLGHLRESEAAATEAVDLARELYGRGVADFQSVLDAERTLFNVQEQRALSDRDLATDLVSLYKALGGGWEALAPERKS